MSSDFLVSTPVAHRGLHDETRPENSLPAFLAAIERGYAIETDVRFTKDKKLVVFHDDTLLRMTGDPRLVSDCNYADLPPLLLRGASCPPPGVPLILSEAKDPPNEVTSSSESSSCPPPDVPLILSEAKDPPNEVMSSSEGTSCPPPASGGGVGVGVCPQTQSNPARIPLFSEFLDAVAGRVPLLIEIKNMPGVKGKEIAAATYDLLKEYDGEYAVQSFNPLYVRAYKKLCPAVPCGVLGTGEAGAAKGLQGHIIKHMSLNFWVKPDFISYRKEDLPRRKIERFRGVKLAWVVRSEAEAVAARRYVDNVIFEDFLP